MLVEKRSLLHTERGLGRATLRPAGEGLPMENRRIRPAWIPLAAGAVSCAAVALLVAWSPLGLGPNPGMPFGYYGKLNRVLDRWESLPGVHVRNALVNRDVHLEDFTVELLVHGSHRTSLEFPDAPAEALLAIVDRWAQNELPRLNLAGTQ